MKRIFAIAGWTLFGLLMLLIAAAGVLVVLMTGQTGRDLIQNTLDGREVAGIEIRIGRLSGNPLDRLTVGRLSLADEDGVWLEAEELVIDWRPRDLLARTVAAPQRALLVDNQRKVIEEREDQRRDADQDRQDTEGHQRQGQGEGRLHHDLIEPVPDRVLRDSRRRDHQGGLTPLGRPSRTPPPPKPSET
jgi:hypothetical protein